MGNATGISRWPLAIAWTALLTWSLAACHGSRSHASSDGGTNNDGTTSSSDGTTQHHDEGTNGDGSQTHQDAGPEIDGGTGVFADMPNESERAMLVFMNRWRAEPNPHEWCPDSHESPVPQLGYDYDLAQAARFHCVHSYINNGGLSHKSYCTLRDDIEATGCDGHADCSCQAGIYWTRLINGAPASFFVTYYDPAGQDPQVVYVVEDGTCKEMNRELGVPGNRGYRLEEDLPTSECHEYYFVAKDAQGHLYFAPEQGAYATGNCPSDKVATRQSASCAQ